MNAIDAKQILEDFDDSVEICYQDKNNIYKYIPISGFEVKTRRDGKKVLVLLMNKLLSNEFNG